MYDDLCFNPFYSTVEEAQTFQLLAPSLHVMQPKPTKCMPHCLHVGDFHCNSYVFDRFCHSLVTSKTIWSHRYCFQCAVGSYLQRPSSNVIRTIWVLNEKQLKSWVESVFNLHKKVRLVLTDITYVCYVRFLHGSTRTHKHTYIQQVCLLMTHCWTVTKEL
jgi:hypothetical protein